MPRNVAAQRSRAPRLQHVQHKVLQVVTSSRCCGKIRRHRGVAAENTIRGVKCFFKVGLLLRRSATPLWLPAAERAERSRAALEQKPDPNCTAHRPPHSYPAPSRYVVSDAKKTSPVTKSQRVGILRRDRVVPVRCCCVRAASPERREYTNGCGRGRHLNKP